MAIGNGAGVRDDIQQGARSAPNPYDIGAGGIISPMGVISFVPVSGAIFAAVFVIFGLLAPFVLLPMLYLAYRIVFRPPTNYIEQDEPKSWVTGL